MIAPANYREWIYLSSGLDMSYTSGGSSMPRHIFDNVFVNPTAYRAFLATGTWPDKTVLVLEQRGAQTDASINKGQSQGMDVAGLEVHVKDASRGGWAFYSFDSPGPANKIPASADCYRCHREHAAVDTTFVQFYPTLLPAAKQKQSLSAAYLAEQRPAK